MNHRAIIAAGLVLVARPAMAGNEDEFPVGPEAAMTGAAVTATTHDGASAFYNPAGMVGLKEPTLDATVSVYGLRRFDANDFLELEDGRSADASVNEIMVVPVATSYVRPFGRRFSLGGGVFVDKWSDATLRARIVDRPPQALLTAAVREQRLNAVGGAAFALSPSLRFGVSLHVLYTTASVSEQLAEGEDGRNLSVAIFEDSTGLGVRVGSGLQWDVGAGVTLGLAMVTPAARVYSLVVRDESANITIAETNAFSGTGEDVDEVSFSTEQPMRTRLGIAYAVLDGGWVSLDGDVMMPLVNEDLVIDRGLEFNVRLGAKLPLTESFTLGLGAFTDRDPNNRDPVDFYGGSAGITYDNQRHLAADEEDDHITFTTTIALRYAYGVGETGALRVSADGGLVNTTTELVTHEASAIVGGGVRF